MCGAAAVFGLRYCKDRESFSLEPGLGDIKELLFEIQTKFEDKYTGYLCRDITKHLYGRSYDFRKPEDVEAFTSIRDRVMSTCSKVTSDAAGWVVEAILNRENPEPTT
ncbi:C_GCAxxG_C_C family protein [Candidatus Bathyarchaeota archaeon]|nr:C_GCAxxG_C_C family protein [Candidatus Bathyarchaeota archaeon]